MMGVSFFRRGFFFFIFFIALLLLPAVSKLVPFPLEDKKTPFPEVAPLREIYFPPPKIDVPLSFE